MGAVFLGGPVVRFMILTFAVLSWAFYELSGGSQFAPPEAVPAPLIARAEQETMIGAAHAGDAAEIVEASFAEPVVVTGASEFAPPPAAVAAVAPEPPADIRTVAGSRVNMRSGPGTSHGVLTVLSRGDPTEVLAVDGRWARIRAGGIEGWMALSMLSEEG